MCDAYSFNIIDPKKAKFCEKKISLIQTDSQISDVSRSQNISSAQIEISYKSF